MNDRPAEPTEAPDAISPGMPAEHALLGLLATNPSGASHGYDLARHFDAEAPLGTVIRLEAGMVYHHLKKLERIGWVAVVPEEAPGRPTRRLFALSDEGKGELWRWLSEPVAHTREIRLEFLVKLYFALLLDSALARRLIDEQRERCARIIDALSHRLQGDEAVESDARARRFGNLVLDMRLAQTRAALAWLDRVKRDTESPVAGTMQPTTGVE